MTTDQLFNSEDFTAWLIDEDIATAEAEKITEDMAMVNYIDQPINY